MDNTCISFGIKMTETLAIDNVLLKIKSSQGNGFFITGNHTLRKKRRKCKPMNVAYEIDKLMVGNHMKDEGKIEIVANNYNNSYVDAISYDQSMSCKKSIDLAKIYKQLLTCDKSMSSDMNAAPRSLYTNLAEVSNSSN